MSIQEYLENIYVKLNYDFLKYYRKKNTTWPKPLTHSTSDEVKNEVFLKFCSLRLRG